MYEKIVEKKQCKQCNGGFEITYKDMEFYNKISPIFEGKKYQIPAPKICPECRQQRRLSFRNERTLYKRKCDATGEDIISIYSPNIPYTVYNKEYWWSDKWDAGDYSQNFDITLSFFQQLDTLMNKVPQCSLFQINLENSKYCNIVANSKNSYLVFASSKLEDCCFGVSLEKCKGVFDSLLIKDSENIYESFMLDHCFDIFYSSKSSHCLSSIFINDCENCENCLLCSGLKNKKYHIWNQEVSKGEFIAKKEEILQLSHINFLFLQKKYIKWKQTIPSKALNIINSENIVGDNLISCSSSFHCFDCFEIQKSKYLIFGIFGIYSCMDCDYSGHDISFCYESHLVVFGSNNVIFSNNIVQSHHIYYSYNCYYSSYLFGCIGLKNKQYCILNKQYTKEQYNKHIPQIIANMQKTLEWGEFFISNISPFGYNETVAQEYFSLTKQEAIQKGFKWSDFKYEYPKVSKTIPANKLPQNINDIPDDILNWAIECEITKKPFKIISQELEFYRKHKLPIPKRHPDQRHTDRMNLRNPRKLFERNCDKCNIKMETSYNPDRLEKVYCEECYNKEIY